MNTSLPRILFIIDYYHPHIGGLEVVFENIVQRLLKKGYTVGILTSRHASTLPEYEMSESGLEIRRVGSNREVFLRSALRRGRKIIDRYDVIHTTTYASAIPASLLGYVFNKKVILTVHEIFGPKLRRRYKPYRWRLYQRFEQIIFWFLYTHIVCVSKYTKRMLHNIYKIPKKRLKVIYNGIDTDVRDRKKKDTAFIKQFRKTHAIDNEFVILYYGHSGASKGLSYLIKAIPTLCEKNPETKIILNIAPGKRDYIIFDLIQKLGIQDNIILLHGLEQSLVRNLVLLSNVVIVPSVSDGFGLVAAEVSALQHPLIVTKNGSLPEVVSGNVVFLKNYTPTGFLKAIQKVKKQKRADISVKTFDRKKTVSEYEKLYTQ